MKHISEIIEDILVEWAYRVHDGMPNPKNIEHIHNLRESMEELNIPNNVIYQVIKNLINEDRDETKGRRAAFKRKKIIKWKDKDNKERETSLDTIRQYKSDIDFEKNKNKQLAVKAAGLDKEKDKDDKKGEKEKKEPKKVTFKKTDDYLTEITKRDLQTRIVSIGSGLGLHSNVGRVKNDNDLSDSDFINLIKKEFNVDKVDLLKPNTGVNKSSKFNMFKWNADNQDLSITLAGKVTGRGTSQTKDQEMSFLLVLSALQYGANPNNKEEFISTLLDSNVYGRVYDGGSISEKDALGLAAWLENNDDWYNSHVKQCQGFMSSIGNKQAKKYVKDDSKLDVNIQAKKLYKAEYNENLDLDKWNPADVWLYYDTKAPTFEKLADLNNYLLDSLNGKGVIGISLKKGTGNVSIINGTKKKKYILKKIDTKFGKFFSQNVYFEYNGENLDGLSLSFRIFQASSEELIRGEGGSKGALAVQGKVKLSVLDSLKGGIVSQVKKVLGGDTFDYDKKTNEFSLSKKGLTKYKLVQKAYKKLKSKMSMARCGNKKEYDGAFKNEKTFITMVNDWAKSSGAAENKVKALMSSRFQTIVLGSIIANLSKSDLEKVMIGMLKYGKSESDWSSAHFKLQ